MKVIDHHGYCDGSDQHALHLTTDGEVAVAYGETTDAEVSLDALDAGDIYVVRCGQPDREDDPCNGTMEVGSLPGEWSDATPEQLTLLRFGKPVA